MPAVKTKSIKPERSEAQRRQARINGARSRGPTTAEGKAVSCRNALQHGYRAETVVSARDRPRYDDLQTAILNDLPRPPRTVDALLAGDVASAVIRVELICRDRISSVALAKRAIRNRHNRPWEVATKHAIRALNDGNLFEAYEFQRQTPNGCRRIADSWAEIQDRLECLPTHLPVPADVWEDVLGLVVTLEPVYQSLMKPQYDQAAATGSIGRTALIEHCQAYVQLFQARADQLTKDHRRTLKHKLTIAEADLGVAGQKRDRYLQMARSTIARLVQQMDLETHRQWRRAQAGEPAPNEPENIPEIDLAQDLGTIHEPEPIGLDEPPATLPEPLGVAPAATVEPPPIAPEDAVPPAVSETAPEPEPTAPNEPEKASEVDASQSLRELVESLRPPWLDANDEPIAGAEPDSRGAAIDSVPSLELTPIGREMKAMLDRIARRAQESAEAGHPGRPRTNPRTAPNEPENSPKSLISKQVASGQRPIPKVPVTDRDRR